jgi:hypothetical protein
VIQLRLQAAYRPSQMRAKLSRCVDERPKTCRSTLLGRLLKCARRRRFILRRISAFRRRHRKGRKSGDIAMQLATSERNLECYGLGAAKERWVRPAVGFNHPRDVLKDPFLDNAEKRAVLSSWASDASSVREQPSLRWLLGTPEPVPLSDIREAMAKLDRQSDDPPPSNRRLS